MPIGPAVRARLGRFETPAAEAYRSAFFSIQDFARQLAKSVPSARRILEIGCGDGSVANTLVKTYPGVDYVGIDISPEPGRRFGGNRSKAQFHSIRSDDYVATSPGTFDLVLVVDVLHHVPHAERGGLLRDVEQLLSPDGSLVIKEWIRSRSLPYLVGANADRYVSGDRAASFMTGEELRQLVQSNTPGLVETHRTTVKPWACNSLMTLNRAQRPS